MFVFPGIVLVKDLHDGYHEWTASLKVIRSDMVQATVNGESTEYAVHPFVYF
jgi:hypothetical protein